MVWFIDDSAAGGGNGTAVAAFQSLAPLNNDGTDPDGADDFIYVAEGNYTGGIVLENGQKLIGEGVALDVSGTSLRPVGTVPTIEDLGKTIVALAQNNTVAGVIMGSDGASGLVGQNFGTLRVDAVGIQADQALSLTNGTVNGLVTGTGNFTGLTALNVPDGSDGILLDNVSGAFSVASSSGTHTGANSSLPNNTGIRVQNSSGSFAFGTTRIGGISSPDKGISLTSNTGTFTFDSLDVITKNGFGIQASNGGTIVVTGSGGTRSIAATGGPALDLTNTTISNGAGGPLTFGTITTTSSSAEGINLDSVTGSFTVTGFTTITGASAAGIDIFNSPGTFTFNDLKVDGTGGAGLIASSAGTVNVTGTSTIDNANLFGILLNNTNVSVTGTLNIGGSTAVKGVGVGIQINDGAPHSIGLSGVTISNTELSGIQVRGGGTTTIQSLSNIAIINANTNPNSDRVGIELREVTLDSDPLLVGNQQVNAGTISIGSSNNRVEGKGFEVVDATGSLNVTTLDIFNHGGPGLSVETSVGGTAFNLTTGANSTIDTSNGAAVDMTRLSGQLTFDSITSIDASTGIKVNQLNTPLLSPRSRFEVTGTTSLTGTGVGAAINIIDSSADFVFNTTRFFPGGNLSEIVRGLRVSNSPGDDTKVSFNGFLAITATTPLDVEILGDSAANTLLEINAAGAIDRFDVSNAVLRLSDSFLTNPIQTTTTINLSNSTLDVIGLPGGVYNAKTVQFNSQNDRSLRIAGAGAIDGGINLGFRTTLAPRGTTTAAEPILISGPLFGKTGSLLEYVFDTPAGLDRLNVTGTVTLETPNSRPSPQLVVNTAQYTPVAGDTFTLIDNDGTDAVVGTFDGLPEGGTFTSTQGDQFQITYQGGDGNDVVLTALGNTPVVVGTRSAGEAVQGSIVTFTGSAFGSIDDHITARLDAAAENLELISANGLVDVSQIPGATGNLTATATVPLAGLELLRFHMDDGDDTLIFDTTNGVMNIDSFFRGGIGQDGVQIIGSNMVDGVRYAPGPEATDAVVAITHAGVTQRIQAEGIEPVIITVPSVLTVDGPATGNTIVVGSAADDSMTRIGIGGYEVVEYSNQSAVTINMGDGNDQLSIRSDVVKTPFTINGGHGDDELTYEVLTDIDAAALLTFSGGDQLSVRGDIMNLIAEGNIQTLDIDYLNQKDGIIRLNGNEDGTVAFMGLEPVVVNAGSINNAIFTLPATADHAVLSDLPGGKTRLASASSPTTFERTDFTSPTGSLTVNAGDGDDVIEYSIVGPYPASVVLDGGGGTDTLNLTGTSGNDDLSITDGQAVWNETTLDFANITEIIASLGEGADSVNVTPLNIPVSVNLGPDPLANVDSFFLTADSFFRTTGEAGPLGAGRVDSFFLTAPAEVITDDGVQLLTPGFAPVSYVNTHNIQIAGQATGFNSQGSANDDTFIVRSVDPDDRNQVRAIRDLVAGPVVVLPKELPVNLYGTTGDDHINFFGSPSADDVVIDGNAISMNQVQYALNLVEAIEVDLGGGNDSASAQNLEAALKIDGGAGHNALNLVSNGNGVVVRLGSGRIENTGGGAVDQTGFQAVTVDANNGSATVNGPDSGNVGIRGTDSGATFVVDSFFDIFTEANVDSFFDVFTEFNVDSFFDIFYSAESESGSGAQPQLLGSDGNDNFTLSGTTINGDSFFRPISLRAVTQLNVQGGSGDDTLVIDETAGLLPYAGGVHFDGGPGDNAVRLVGDNPGGSHVITPGPDNTTVVAELSDAASNKVTVEATGLKPYYDLVTGVDLTLIAKGAANAVNLAVGPNSGLTNAINPTALLTGLFSVDDYETIEFGGKTNVIIEAGAGPDQIGLSTIASGLSGTLTVKGGDPANGDRLVVQGTSGNDAFGYVPNFSVHDTGTVTLGGRTLVFETVDQVLIDGLGGTDTLTAAPGNTMADDQIVFAPAERWIQYNASVPIHTSSIETITLGAGLSTNGDLYELRGSTSADDVIIHQTTVPQVDANGIATLLLFDSDGADRLDVHLDGGDDEVITETFAELEVILLGEAGQDLVQVASSGGAVDLKAAGPQLVEAGRQAITIDAEEVTLFASSAVVSLAGTDSDDVVQWNPAADNAGVLTFNSLRFELQDAGGLTVAPGDGVDSVTVLGNASDNAIEVTRGATTTVAVDARLPIDVDAAATEALTVHGGLGDDIFTVTGTGGPALTIDGAGPLASDRLVVTNAGVGDRLFTVTPGATTNSGKVQLNADATRFDNIEHVTLDFNGMTAGATVNGTDADNTITVTAGEQPALLVGGPVTIAVDDRAATELVNYPASSQVKVDAGAGSDLIDVAPTTAFGMHFLVSGGDSHHTDVLALTGTDADDQIAYRPAPDRPEDGLARLNDRAIVFDGIAEVLINGLTGDDSITTFGTEDNEDYWTNVGVPHDALGFGFTKPIVGSSPDASTTINLFAADGSELRKSDGSELSQNIVAGVPNPAAGDVTFSVGQDSNDEIDIEYDLFTVFVDPNSAQAESGSNDTSGEANAVTAGLVTGTLAGALDTDFFSFPVQTGDSFFIIVDQDPNNTGTATQTELSFFKPDGDTLVGSSDSPAGAAANALGPFTADETGDYFVRIAGTTGSPGTLYRFVVQILGDPAPTAPGDVEPNDSPAFSQPIVFTRSRGALKDTTSQHDFVRIVPEVTRQETPSERVITEEFKIWFNDSSLVHIVDIENLEVDPLDGQDSISVDGSEWNDEFQFIHGRHPVINFNGRDIRIKRSSVETPGLEFASDEPITFHLNMGQGADSTIVRDLNDDYADVLFVTGDGERGDDELVHSFAKYNSACTADLSCGKTLVLLSEQAIRDDNAGIESYVINYRDLSQVRFPNVQQDRFQNVTFLGSPVIDDTLDIQLATQGATVAYNNSSIGYVLQGANTKHFNVNLSSTLLGAPGEFKDHDEVRVQGTSRDDVWVWSRRTPTNPQTASTVFGLSAGFTTHEILVTTNTASDEPVLESVVFAGGAGADVFHVEPGPADVSVDGGDPIASPPDKLVVNATTSDPVRINGFPFSAPEIDSGSVTVGSLGPISYDHIERVEVNATGSNDPQQVSQLDLGDNVQNITVTPDGSGFNFSTDDGQIAFNGFEGTLGINSLNDGTLLRVDLTQNAAGDVHFGSKQVNEGSQVLNLLEGLGGGIETNISNFFVAGDGDDDLKLQWPFQPEAPGLQLAGDGNGRDTIGRYGNWSRPTTNGRYGNWSVVTQGLANLTIESTTGLGQFDVVPAGLSATTNYQINALATDTINFVGQDTENDEIVLTSTRVLDSQHNVSVGWSSPGRLSFQTGDGDDLVIVDIDAGRGSDLISVPVSIDGESGLGDAIEVRGTPSTAIDSMTYAIGKYPDELRAEYSNAAGDRLMLIEGYGQEPFRQNGVQVGTIKVTGTDRSGDIIMRAECDPGTTGLSCFSGSDFQSEWVEVHVEGGEKAKFHIKDYDGSSSVRAKSLVHAMELDGGGGSDRFWIDLGTTDTRYKTHDDIVDLTSIKVFGGLEGGAEGQDSLVIVDSTAGETWVYDPDSFGDGHFQGFDVFLGATRITGVDYTNINDVQVRAGSFTTTASRRHDTLRVGGTPNDDIVVLTPDSDDAVGVELFDSNDSHAANQFEARGFRNVDVGLGGGTDEVILRGTEADDAAFVAADRIVWNSNQAFGIGGHEIVSLELGGGADVATIEEQTGVDVRVDGGDGILDQLFVNAMGPLATGFIHAVGPTNNSGALGGMGLVEYQGLENFVLDLKDSRRSLAISANDASNAITVNSSVVSVDAHAPLVVIGASQSELTVEAGGGDDKISLENSAFRSHKIHGGGPDGSDQLIISGTNGDDLFGYAPDPNDPRAGFFVDYTPFRATEFKEIEHITINGLQGEDVLIGSGPEGGKDKHRGQAPAGGRAWSGIVTAPASPPSGSSDDPAPDPTGKLLNADGTMLLGADDNSGPGTTAVLANIPVAAGETEFLIEVGLSAESSDVVDYQLFTAVTNPNNDQQEDESSERNDSPATATPFTFGVAMNGSLEPDPAAPTTPDVDYFSFTANPGDTVFVIVDNNPEKGTDPTTDTLVSIVSANAGEEEVAAGGNKESAPANAAGPFHVQQAGEYFVKVARGPAAESDITYTVLVMLTPSDSIINRDGEPNDLASTATPIESPVQTGSVTRREDVDNSVVFEPLGNDEANVRWGESAPLRLLDIEANVLSFERGTDAVTVNASELNDIVTVDSGTTLLGPGRSVFVNGQPLIVLGEDVLTVNTRHGDDHVTVTPSLTSETIINGGDFSQSNVLNVKSTGSDVTLTLPNLPPNALPVGSVMPTNAQQVAFNGFQQVNIDAANQEFTAYGTENNDAVTITPEQAGNTILSTDSVNTRFSISNAHRIQIGLRGGHDQLSVNGTIGEDSIAVDGSSVTISGTDFHYLDTEALLVSGLQGADTFTVKPAIATEIFIDGGNPIGFGDTLNVDAGLGNATHHPGPESDEGAYSITTTSGSVFDGTFMTHTAVVNYDHIDSQPTIVANNPPVADAGGPYTVKEGSKLILDGTRSSDPDSDPLRYAWDFNYDAQNPNETFDTDATGAKPTFDASVIDGTPTSQQMIALLVTDGQDFHISPAVVTIQNVAPEIVTQFNPTYQVPPTFSVGLNVHATDQANNNGIVNDPLTFQWDLDGDGTFGELGLDATNGDEQWQAVMFTSAASHGTRVPITVRVTDGDGGSVERSTTMIVFDPSNSGTAPRSNLAATITIPTTPIPLGGLINGSVAVSNAGPDQAVNASVLINLPTGVALDSALPSECTSTTDQLVCSLGDIPNGDTTTIDGLQFRANRLGRVTFTAAASADVVDDVASNNLRSVETVILPVVDLPEGESQVFRDGTDLVVRNTSSVELLRVAFAEALGVILRGTDAQNIVDVSSLDSGQVVIEQLAHDDRLNLLGEAQWHSGIFIADVFHNVLNLNGTDVFVVNAKPWQNPANPLDVNHDGFVSPVDAVIMINRLNTQSAATLPVPTPGFFPSEFHYDVNGDNTLAPVDVIVVVNFLNGPSVLAAEAEDWELSTAIGAIDLSAPNSVAVRVGTSSDRQPDSFQLEPHHATSHNSLFANYRSTNVAEAGFGQAQVQQRNSSSLAVREANELDELLDLLATHLAFDQMRVVSA